MARQTDITRKEERGLDRPTERDHPFRMLEQFADEMDRIFNDFGFGSRWMAPRPGRGWSSPTSRQGFWQPQIEVLHRNDQLIVRADLPGMSKDDIRVDVADEHLTIQGERRQEQQEEREGLYRSERSYGSFRRTIPLPPGTMSDQAKAAFRNGVLEITMPAPPESARQGRRLEITESAPDVKPHVEK